MEILIVEDESFSRRMLGNMVSAMGHVAVEAQNGRQAWEIVQQRQIQFIITDWIMPEMNGLELCRHVRNASTPGYVYIIMLTAKDRKEDLVDVFDSGADDYIPKPFDPEELKARVLTGLRIIDLEERHNKLQNTLIESRNKLRVVFDSLREEIVSLNTDFAIVSANKAFVDALGCDPVTIVGRNWFDICPLSEKGAICNSIKQLVTKVFDEGKAQNMLFKGKATDGLNTYKQVGCLPIKDEQGRVFQVTAVITDITEDRRKTEEIQGLNERILETSAQIEAQNKKLKTTLKRLEDTQAQMLQSEKMASIGQLAAGVAHEINNPTGFVSSNLKTLGDYQADIGALLLKFQALVEAFEDPANKGKLPAVIEGSIQELIDFQEHIDIQFLMEDIADLINDCREGTERIKKIVLDLKDFAHPGEDKIQSTDINKGLESTLNVVNNEIKYKATVHKDFGQIPTVRGYPQQINQVFMNILVNAAQAIEKKGEIHIRTRNRNGYVEVFISDTGCGIPAENIPKIFDPFYTTKDVGKGTGLGMNIAYNIIQKHNGTIDVQSEVGKGTTFCIRIPAETP